MNSRGSRAVAQPIRWLRHRLGKVTLRTRLISGMLALLLAACAVVGLATLLSLHRFLVNRLDQQLSDAGSRLATSLGTAAAAPVPGQSVGTLAARISGGSVTSAAMVRGDGDNDTDDLARLDPADRAALTALPRSGAPRTIPFEEIGRYRVAAVPGAQGSELIVGLPMRSVDDTVDRLQLIEVAVFGAVLVVSAVAGAGFVRWSLRPLRRVTATATAVSALPLESGAVMLPERVSTADPATEVGQVGAAINHMLDHVENSLTARAATEERLRRFIADASHELRTPLAVIRSHAEAARRTRQPLPEDAAHALDRVVAASARMGSLVEDLLLLTRLDAGRPLAQEPVDLTRLAIEAVSDARAAGRDHRWALELPEEPVTVTGDEQRLHQVLANLLANARAHTPAGTTVTVRVGTTGGDAADGDAAELTVADDGPGIPAELQPRLFERFVRGSGAQARTSGTGLGLAIVAAVVHAHRGRLTVHSQPGHTQFLVRLPNTGEPAGPGSPSSPGSPGSESSRPATVVQSRLPAVP